MFCRLGLLLESLPVAAAAWLYMGWMKYPRSSRSAYRLS